MIRPLCTRAFLVGFVASIALGASPVAGAGRSVISFAVAGDDPIAVAVDAGLNLVFVASRKSKTISVLAGQNASLVATIPTNGAGSPTALAVNARTHRLYELDATLMQLAVIDAGSRALLLSLPVGSGSRWVAVDQQSNRIFVSAAANGAATLTAFNGSTNTTMWTRPLGAEAGGLAADPANGLIYVTDPARNLVLSYSEASGTQVGVRTVAGGPTALAVDSTAGASTLWVASPQTSSVNRLTSATGPPYPVDVPGVPAALAVNGENHRAYALSTQGGGARARLPGVLSILEGPHNNLPPAVVEKRFLPGTPVAAAVDLANYRLFVANAADSQSSGTVGVVSRFDPLAHGFHFVNHFAGTIPVSVPGIGNVNLASFAYGLCGGMVFGAVDTYYAGGRTPSDLNPPAQGSKLRGWLTTRLLETWPLPGDLAVLRRFLEWEARPYHSTYTTGLKSLSYKEFKYKIRPRLDQGIPVPLGIVKVDRVGHPADPPWNDHQVLATGYFFNNPTGEFVIEVYDPNVPDRFVYMWTDRRLETLGPAGGTVVPHSGFRGYFAVWTYGRKQPYWVPAPPKSKG